MYYHNNLSLHDKFVVENYFCELKNNNRIIIRKDKNIETFSGFIFISMIKTYFNYVNNNIINDNKINITI